MSLAPITGSLAAGCLSLLALVTGGSPSCGETFRFGAVGITVPDGFAVQRVAGQPLVERPVAVAFDEDGRLYVTDSSGSNAKLVEQQDDPQHRIFRLEDRDGDGIFDTRTLFADRLMMLQGTLWYRGSLYAAAGPQIWKLTDSDGDGVADDRSVWFDGKTLTGCGNDMHGPYLGRDGWFYWCKGAFAEQTHDLPGKPGWKTRASHVFRARPDRPVGEIEAVMTGGMDNPVDVAFTTAGERLVSATFLEHPAGGKRDGVIHALYGGVYGKEHGVLDGHPRTGGLLPALVHLGPAAACGLHVHSGHGLGGDCAGDVFACSFNLRTVSRHRLVQQGGTFTTVDEPFVVGDAADFHPTDVIEDADGSLLIVDTGGWYKLCCPTSQLEKPAVLGAIYRIRNRTAATVHDPRGRRIDWRRLDAAGLASLLADGRPAVAERAIDELRRRGEAAVEPMAWTFSSEPAAAAGRRNAVWALAGIDSEAARATVRQGLRDGAAEVRQAAAHVAGLQRDSAAVDALSAQLSDADAGCMRAAAEALGRIGTVAAVKAVLAACPRAADRACEHSLTYALIEGGQPELLLAAVDAPDPRVRRAALVALDQGPAGDTVSLRERVLTACGDDDPGLREAGWWIASRHPEWARALVAQLPAELERAVAKPEESPRIVGIVGRLAANEAIATALAAAARAGIGTQAKALEVMRAARPAKTPDAWVDALVAVIGGDSPMASADAIETLARLTLAPEQRSRVRTQLLALAAASELSPKLCTLLVQVAAGNDPLPGPVAERLLEILLSAVSTGTSGDASPLDRSAAATALQASRLSDDQFTRLAPALGRLPANDVAQLLPLFKTRGGGPLVAALAAVAGHADPSSIGRDAVAAAVAALPTGDEASGRQLLERIDAARAGQRAAYERLAAALPPGDAARGHAVFVSAKAACTGCHAMAYVGGRIGPDLSKIGGIRTPRDLLEAIVLPSSSFVRSYEPVTVLTEDGRAYSGIVREETPAEVVIQTNVTASERIPRAAIESIEAGTVSLMPKGYDTILSPQELADLVAFLARAK
jgi:putative membrane-bound dehydrogenase-like protein